MNTIDSLIPIKTAGACAAAAHDAGGSGKERRPGATGSTRTARFAVKGIALSLMLAFGSNGYALPVGGAVSAGNATIATVAAKTTITQSSQNVAINWTSFSIGAAEAVQFVQPNSSSVALNRVLGSDPSSILGSLSANGKVFLVNPNGILFGRGASVNVGGLVASTRGITDTDFMAGNYKFSGSGGGSIVNQGTINADGGYVALLGANISNEGVISAKLGTVSMAAGDAFTLDVAGDGLLNVMVNQGAVNALVQNGGLIRADGGQVLLTAQAAGNLLQSAVNNTGVIQAQTVVNHNGTIRLLAGTQNGTVNVSGTLDASGTGAGQTGGSVTITGEHVGLFGGTINAAGDAGGGTVLVGGGYQGNNAAVQNASATYMSVDSAINADAITNGNGGTVVVWSNDSTRAYGSIVARGGAQSGNGGLIETSGHWLDTFGININAGAPNGVRGMWLLDPADVTITAGALNNTRTGNVFAPDSGANTSQVDVGTLQTALGVGAAGTDITITTTNSGAVAGVPPSGLGNITVASAITWSPTARTTLTLIAAGDVNINQAITATGGSLTVNAGQDVFFNAPVTTTRGNVVVCCGRDINVNALITTTGVAATPNSGGNVLLSAGRNVNISRSAGANSLAGITTTDGNMEICAGENINLFNTLNNPTALLTLTTSVAASGLPAPGLAIDPVTPRGMTLIAGTNGTGPGAAGGTLNIGTGVRNTVTGPGVISPINIYYNPTNYTTPTDYTGFFNGTPGTITEYMLVFPTVAAKVADGTTTATLTGLKGSPAGVSLNAGGTATFDTALAGVNKTVSFTGVTITQVAAVAPGGAAINYALPVTCCAPIVGKTLATITAAPVIPVVPPAPPPDVPLPDAEAAPGVVLAEGGTAPSIDNALELESVTPAGLNLTVVDTGVRMPFIQLAGPPPPMTPIVPTRAQAFVPPPPPPPAYVPPPLPRKPDRN